MQNTKAYLTVRYYANKNSTRYKIVSFDGSKWYEAYESLFINGHLEWHLVCSDSKFKEVYDFVQENLNYV